MNFQSVHFTRVSRTLKQHDAVFLLLNSPQIYHHPLSPATSDLWIFGISTMDFPKIRTLFFKS